MQSKFVLFVRADSQPTVTKVWLGTEMNDFRQNFLRDGLGEIIVHEYNKPSLMFGMVFINAVDVHVSQSLVSLSIYDLITQVL